MTSGHSASVHSSILRETAPSILENVQLHFFILSMPDYRYVFMNKTACQLVEHFTGNHSSAVGRHPWEVLPGWKEALFDAFEQARIAAHPMSFSELRTVSRGEVMYWDVSIVPIIDDSGEVECLAAFAMDATQRKQAEDALRDSRDRLTLAVEAGEIGTWDSDYITGKTVWSERSKEMYGVTPDMKPSLELLISLVHPDDRERVREVTRRALSPDSSGEFTVEHRIVRPDGTVRWVSSRGHGYFRRIGDECVPVRFTGTVVDITDHKHVEDALRHQFHLLQRALTPPRPAAIGGYEVASRYIPATGGDIGGDFFDVFPTSSSQVCVMIGDVTGKGIPAASFGAAARSTLRAFAWDNPASGPGEILTRANRVLMQQQEGSEQFVTAFLMLLDTESGYVRYSNAGHPPAAVCRTSGEVEWLSFGYPPMAVMQDFGFDDAETCLGPGEKVILYTDGITESRHGSELLDTSGLEHILAGCAQLSPDELAGQIIEAASSWSQGCLRDDTALIVVGREDG